MDQMNIFGMNSELGGLSLFGDAEKKEAEEKAKAEEKKAEKKKEKKPSASKSKAKKPAAVTLTGAITVLSSAFRYVVENDGEMSVIDALKKAYEAGFKEVAVSNVTRFDNTLLIDTFGAGASPDDEAVQFVGGVFTVALGQHRVELSADMFDDLEEDEISVYDVTRKYVELNPDFKGCGLSVAKGIAAPVFSEQKEKDELPETVRVYADGAVQEMEKEEFFSSLPADDAVEVQIFASSTGALFTSYVTKERVAVKPEDFDLKVDAKKVAERYKLPFTLRMITFNTRQELTSEDFGGKSAVTKDELLEYLKAQRIGGKVFQQDRQIEVYYDENNAIVSVAIVSGKKGGEIIEHPSYTRWLLENDAFQRIVDAGAKFFGLIKEKGDVAWQDTDIGVFFSKWSKKKDDTPIAVDFAHSKLPKVPYSILKAIVTEFQKDLSRETMVFIMWNTIMKQYYLAMPEMVTSKVSIDYYASAPEMMERGDLLFMTVHSHNTMPAFWSDTDNEDECYTGLFGVIGRLDQANPMVRIRCGVEGCFKELALDDIFEAEPCEEVAS